MVFSSTLFLTMFFPFFLGTYFLSHEKFRTYVLLFFSLFFYSWGEPVAVFIMMFLIMFSWKIALLIEESKYRNFFFSFGISVNLLALILYKYLSFLIENLNILLKVLNVPQLHDPQIALPIGISFYVFQIISYLFDTYRKEIIPQKNLVLLATYISLFPQLIAGPIVRYKTIETELTERRTDFDNVYQGLRRFILGLAKKVLIADQMALAADIVFNSPVHTVPTVFAWIGIIAYSLQIFYDFSAYSDMAIGLGRILNLHFMENFNYPYSSKSIREFWKRWHISLSSWLRDYLYIPLGGNRKSPLKTYFNLFIVFLCCGLWHGATWNFVVWGAYYGVILIAERLGVSNVLKKFPSIMANLYVWLLVIVGWVLFRAVDLPHAFAYLKIMFLGNSDYAANTFYQATRFLTFSNGIIMLIGIYLSYPHFENIYKRKVFGIVDSSLVFVLFVVAYVFAITSTFSPFIYFRF